MIDIAPLESVQDKLSRQMEAHERTLDKVSMAVAIFTADQRLSFYNQAFRDVWKLDIAWLEGKPLLGEFLDLLRQKRQIPEQPDYRKWREYQLRAAGNNETLDDWWHLPDGRTIHLLADRRPDGGVTYLFDDVSERLLSKAGIIPSLKSSGKRSKISAKA